MPNQKQARKSNRIVSFPGQSWTKCFHWVRESSSFGASLLSVFMEFTWALNQDSGPFSSLLGLLMCWLSCKSSHPWVQKKRRKNNLGHLKHIDDRKQFVGKVLRTSHCFTWDKHHLYTGGSRLIRTNKTEWKPFDSGKLELSLQNNTAGVEMWFLGIG